MFNKTCCFQSFKSMGGIKLKLELFEKGITNRDNIDLTARFSDIFKEKVCLKENLKEHLLILF